MQILGKETIRQRERAQDKEMERLKYLSDLESKRALMKYYKDDIAARAKTSANEEEKLELTRLGAQADLVLKSMDTIGDSTDPMRLGAKIAMLLSPTWAKLKKNDPNGVLNFDDVPQSAQAQAHIGQATESVAKAGLRNAITSRIMEGGAPRASGAVGQPLDAGGSQGGGQGGSLSFMGANLDGMQFDDLGAQADAAAMKTFATKSAEQRLELMSLQNSFGALSNTMMQAIDEMGGLPETELGAIAKGAWRGTLAMGRPGSKIPAVGYQLKNFALQLASFQNRGRPNDADYKAAMAALIKLTHSKETNAQLMAYMRSIISGEGLYKVSSERDWAGTGHGMASSVADDLWDYLTGNLKSLPKLRNEENSRVIAMDGAQPQQAPKMRLVRQR